MENGVDPIMVTKLAGWSSIKMLDRYAHADPSRMAEAVEGLSRRDIHSASERRVLRPRKLLRNRHGEVVEGNGLLNRPSLFNVTP
jgi:hypothetical protein